MSHVYNSFYDASTGTSTNYDILDREVKVLLPTGDNTLMSYGFAAGAFKTTVTDALDNTVVVLKNSRGAQLKIEAPDHTITSFEYNPLGELMSSTDPDGYVTRYAYDMLGQRVLRIHPDAGTDQYKYDPAGNLIQHSTQKLREMNTSVNYVYYYNQLTEIRYPNYPQNNVYYTYGTMGAMDNRAARIMLQEDGSGYQLFSYGKLGEITKNVRTFVLPNEELPYTFTMEFKYDSWNRIQTMIYPDKEKVNYSYNLGGMLKSIEGDHTYIKNIEYNPFELKSTVEYGNGTVTTYAYDILQRLKELTSYTSMGEKMQSIDYNYDRVSNITRIVNNTGVLSNGLGGDYFNKYAYDNLYRLIDAEGKWNDQCSYELNMSYAKNGRITHKRQYIKMLEQGNVLIKEYGRDYYYHPEQPNTLHFIRDVFTKIKEFNFQWDANGNMIYQEELNQNERFLCWDEENRLMGVKDENYSSFYQYDAAGERTYKLTGAREDMLINGRWTTGFNLINPTLYASPYLVATNKGYTKHYYAENERIASRIGSAGLKEICMLLNLDKNFSDKVTEENPELWDCSQKPHNRIVKKIETTHKLLNEVMNCIKSNGVAPPGYFKYLYDSQLNSTNEKEIFWYHPDHLGSSSWITDPDGQAIQHLQYLPFGESFIDQQISSFGSRYTFSAKEKDEETGYGYFGARYYSSDLSIWLSIDPMSDKYPSLSPYTYCANNPIKLIDPNGMDIIDVDEMGKTNITKQEGNDILRSTKTGQTKELSANGVFDAARSETKDGDGNVTSTTLSGMSKDDARATFNFMGDNTDVEWGYMETKNGENSSFTVGSAHNPDGESLVFDMAMDANPGSVVRYDHSHPYDGNNIRMGGNPSTEKTSANSNRYSDVGAWKDLLKVHPKASMGIRFKGNTTTWIKGGQPINSFINKFYK